LAGNSIGKAFSVTSFGESHGKVVGVVIDGCPAGLALSEADIQEELDRRVPVAPKIVSGRIEKDLAKILSGIFNGFTTGAPIALMVENRDVDSSDYEAIKNLPRPGHADYPASVKYGGFQDYRGGGRFSGRVTVSLIMAGAVAKKVLSQFGVDVLAYTRAIGRVKTDKNFSAEEIRKNRFNAATRCPDVACAEQMEEAVIAARKEGESLGGIVECIAMNVPVGVGEPLFDSLDADLGKALFDVPAVKGVEFGLGGLSNGMPILMRVAIKPTPSISKEQKTVNLSTNENVHVNVKGRHDPCVVPKAVAAVESAVAITLVDHMIRAGFIPKVLERRK
jgi:chorismate synthase